MPEQQQQSGNDSSLDFLWGIAFVMGAIIATWYFGKVYISTGVLYVRLYEAIAMDFVFDSVAKFTQTLGLAIQYPNFDGLIVYIRKNIGSALSFSELVTVSNAVGNYLRYLFTLLTLGLAALLYFTGSTHRFRHTFDVKSLRDSERKIWPQINPVIGLNLVDQQLDDGPWAIALSPMNFCKKNDLIDIEKKGWWIRCNLEARSGNKSFVFAAWSKMV